MAKENDYRFRRNLRENRNEPRRETNRISILLDDLRRQMNEEDYQSPSFWRGL